MTYRQLFGSGPTGVLATVLIWIFALNIGRFFQISPINMNDTFRWVLIIFFIIDAGVMVLWSQIALNPNKRGKELVTSGPFRLVRHPLYTAVIWSGTGLFAISQLSWAVVLSVIPVHFFWIWQIKGEEDFMIEKFGDGYKKYMETTGQFFPKLRKKD